MYVFYLLAGGCFKLVDALSCYNRLTIVGSRMEPGKNWRKRKKVKLDWLEMQDEWTEKGALRVYVTRKWWWRELGMLQEDEGPLGESITCVCAHKSRNKRRVDMHVSDGAWMQMKQGVCTNNGFCAMPTTVCLSICLPKNWLFVIITFLS